MHWQYVIPGYLVVFAGLGVYTVSLMSRLRAAAQKVPEEKRAFLE